MSHGQEVVLWQWLIGVFVVVVYANDRFESPLPMRPTTTFVRYWIARSGYVLSMLLLYYVLSQAFSSAPALAAFAGIDEIPSTLNNLPKPLLTALFLTSILPHSPILKKLDEVVKRWFERIGNIPYEVRELSGKLRNGEFMPPKEAAESIRDSLDRLGVKTDWLALPKNTLSGKWARTVALYATVRRWPDSRFARFADRQREKLAEFDQQIEKLGISLRGDTLAMLDMSEHASLAAPLRQKLLTEIDTVYKELCDFVSGGVLECEWAPNSRYSTLAKLGFCSVSKPINPMRADDLVLVIGLIFFVVVVVIVLLGAINGAADAASFRLAVLLPMIYGISIAAAIYPKAAWPYARMKFPGRRPIAAYAICGVLAVAASAPAALILRMVWSNTGNPLDLLIQEGLFSRALNESIQRWPWYVGTFFTTIAIAWAADDYFGVADPPKWLRYAEALALAGFLVLVQFLVLQFFKNDDNLRAFYQLRLEPNRSQIYINSAAIGLCIGFLIPHFYRRSCSAPNHSDDEAVDAASCGIARSQQTDRT
ncbi:hypothetical protein [Caballeronia sp. ATUFL_F1_KS39]|uniref:hypothetical protein n=1 Tax=Caballeronia sp. ATUFL_F1_KS39 TaxID=2921766 RepID=UPI002029749F|nr:hypothetical protein [Caballeronia sp. ATUFL_F1_KS39]